MRAHGCSNGATPQTARTRRHAVGAAFCATSLGACDVDQVFVGSGAISALQDGVSDGLRLAWNGLAGLIAHPLASFDGATLALDRPREVLELYGDELRGYLALLGTDRDGFLYTSALIVCCAVIVVAGAALFDGLLARMPKLRWAPARRRPPAQPVLRHAHVLDRARNMRLEHRLGTTGRGWRRALRRVGATTADVLAGLALTLRRPASSAVYLGLRGARQIGRRLDSLVRGTLRYLVYLLLPLSLVLSPWTAHTVAASRNTGPAEAALAQATALLEASVTHGDDATFDDRLTDLRRAFAHHRRALQAPAAGQDRRLDAALRQLGATADAGGLGDHALDARIERLYERYGHWRLFAAEDIAFGHHQFGRETRPTQRSRLLSHAREVALLARLADAADDRRRGALLLARDDAERALRYERCIALWDPGELLIDPLPAEHACCGWAGVPRDVPVPGCDPESGQGPRR